MLCSFALLGRTELSAWHLIHVEPWRIITQENSHKYRSFEKRMCVHMVWAYYLDIRYAKCCLFLQLAWGSSIRNFLGTDWAVIFAGNILV